jgi:hypothetical protein
VSVKKVRTASAIFVGMVGNAGFLSGIARFYLINSYLSRPFSHEKHEELGRTEPYEIKGGIIYLTREETGWVSGLTYTFSSSIALLILVYAYRRYKGIARN